MKSKIPSASQSKPLAPRHALQSVGQDYLDGVLALFPQEGTALGFEGCDHELRPPTPDVWRDAIELNRNLLARAEAIPAGLLSGDDWIDRRAIIALFRTNLISLEHLASWRVNPQLAVDGAVDSIFRLVTKSEGRLERKLPEIAERLRKIPAYLRAASACLRKPVPLWSGLAAKACHGAVEFLSDLAQAALDVVPMPRGFSAAMNDARNAFLDYARLIRRLAPGSRDGYCVGRDLFEALMRERLGIDWSMGEARAEGERLLARYDKELHREARCLGERAADAAIARMAEQWEPGDTPLLEQYRKVTAHIREQFARLDLVTLPPGESLEVLPVPAYMRHQFPTAAYSSAGPFAKKQRGIFWVNDLSLLAKNEARRRAERAQHFGMELTAVHEAYPGHHLQFSIQHRHPSRIRRFVAHAIAYEGWTLWCERLAVEHGIYNAPHAKLVRLHDAKWRACRIVIDCGLHSGEMSYAAACQFLMERVGFTRARAQGDMNWYTSAPTVPMSYLLGLQEVERLHARHVGAQGWTLKQFNDWILGFGAVPWSWIEKAGLLAGPDRGCSFTP